MQNLKTTELTKNNWKQLIEYGLVDAEGNGFASTTKKADDTLNISRHWNTFVKLKGKSTTFVVRYYDGCFYPLWFKVNYSTKPIEKIEVFSK